MKLENQVCNLELAKKLKELGVKQESLYVWVDQFPIFNTRIRLVSVDMFNDAVSASPLSDEAKALIVTYPAYTVAELGEMLPRFYESHRTNGLGGMEWSCQHKEDGRVEHQIADTEADARAKMLIYLIENNLIKTE